VYHGIVDYPELYAERLEASRFGAANGRRNLSLRARLPPTVSGGDGLEPDYSGTSLQASGSTIGSATPGGGTSTYFDSRAAAPDGLPLSVTARPLP
jgi:hypothetical protein